MKFAGLIGTLGVSTLLGACANIGAPGSAQSPSDSSAAFKLIATCAPLPKTANRCEVNTAPAGGGFTLFGDILVDEGVWKNGGVSVNAAGVIEAVGCIAPPSATKRIDCPNQIVTPGLINAHDHLKYNQTPPGGQDNPRYAYCNDPANVYQDAECANHRYNRRNEWRKGLNGKKMVVAPMDDKETTVLWNELRHIVAGTTTVAGSGGAKGLVRNPDVLALLEGLKVVDNKVVAYHTFPLGDTSDVDGRTDTCAYPKVATPGVLQNRVFLPHVGEGIDAYAHNEVACLSGRGSNPASPGVDLIASNSTFIHGVAVDKADVGFMKAKDMSVVWSPRSNLSLYGNTLPVTLYGREGVNIALATDWTPSGSINLLHEMQCAAQFNSTYLDNYFSGEKLWRMVTANAAKALGFSDQIGAIKVGLLADLTVVAPGGEPSPYLSIIKAEEKDIVLVLRAGAPLYGDSATIAALDQGCETMGDICGSRKSVCLAETGRTFAELKTHNANHYALALCRQDALQPSCTPARYRQYNGVASSRDKDGDGVPDLLDNCPAIFNPARPMDDNKQVDVCGKG
ncbi:amidohydrolase family protein [Chitinimonas arctica]|uniref:Amidohydrolase family protein n=1 Tax=Chitinimonas arctica TaxID=2594795 RepID=A0A516SIL2_9NEIS|nr:amidohydrolase family protein [Chitinimonas arctica]QDQ27986.1 amidohydrolase family protein [Chitinimonas arctica]